MKRNSCYCKLKQLLDELQKEIKRNYSSDSDLANRVLLISDDLDTNTERDELLRERVDNLDLNGVDVNLEEASTEQVDTLFP